MATRHSTGQLPAFPSTNSPSPDIDLSRLSVESLDQLIARRTAALAEMRTAGADITKFNAASKREAELAFRIRQLRAEVARG